MSKGNDWKDRFNKIGDNKKDIEAAKNASHKAIIANLTGEEERTELDYTRIAEELAERQKAVTERKGLNDGYTKDTIYIRDDLYKAFNALCVERGDKKQFANEAIEDFIKKKYEAFKHGEL